MIYCLIHKDELTKEIISYVNQNLKQTLSYMQNYACIRFRYIEQKTALFKGYKVFTKEDLKQIKVSFNSGAKYIKNKYDTSQKQQAFSSNMLETGETLYTRMHGVGGDVASNEQKTFYFDIPYAHCKLDVVEIVGCEDATVSMGISDINDNILNQYGFNVRIAKKHYIRDSKYDASLYQGMRLFIDFYNNADKAMFMGFNVVLHEVVSE